MKAKILATMLSIVMVTACAAGISACTQNTNDVVPTYEGMTISRTVARSTTAASVALSSASAARDKENNGYDPWEDRPGWRPGDGNPHYDYDNDDIEEPEGDIQDVVDIEVVEDSEVRYYVEPGEAFIIEVHLSNPSNYIIQSFTLNGKIYANYMFEDGSTMELLLLKVVAPTIPGYTEYTIDAIKYIDSNDGNAIKDVVFNGDRSVSAGTTYTAEPAAVVNDISVGTTAAEMTVTLTDEQDVLGDSPVNFYLTEGDSVVSISALKEGENRLELGGLVMGKTYRYGVGTYYDLIDGNGVREHWLLEGSFATQKSFAITSAAIYQSQVEFTVSKIGAGSDITSIELIDAIDGSVVSSLADFTQTWFTGLLSDHEYKIRVSFSYQSGGQNYSDSTAISFTTGAKTAPTVEITEVAATQMGVSFDIETTDKDGILNIGTVILRNEEGEVARLKSLEELAFEDILSDNYYEIVVNYSYDLNDGDGEHKQTASEQFKTIAKTIPDAEVVFTDICTDSVKGSLTFIDDDRVGTVISVGLYSGQSLIEEIGKYNEFEVGGLDCYSKYELRVTYTYDLNDGAGIREGVMAFAVTTLPVFEFTSFRVINTSAVSEGEVIYIQSTINNPAGATFTSATINGIEYAVNEVSTTTSLYAEIVNDGQFAGGDTLLTVEKIVVLLDGVYYTILPEVNNSDSVFINGKMYVDSVDVVNDTYEVVEYGYTDKYESMYEEYNGDTHYIRLNLTNPTGYEVYSVNVSGNAITDGIIMGQTADTWYVPYRFSNGVNNLTIDAIKYRNESLDREANVSLPVTFYGVRNSQPIAISSAEDLLNLDGYGLYELTTDINLAGRQWDGGNFNGVLLGNGHAVTNMSVATTLDGGEVYLGLFGRGQGIIKDLTIDNAAYLVDLVAENVSVYYGSFVAYAENNLSLYNCHVVNSAVSLTGCSMRALVLEAWLVVHQICICIIVIVKQISA